MAYDDRDDDDMDDLDIRQPRRGSGETIPNYLVQSILVTLCCCLPFGIAAIINASKVNSHLANGEYEQAVQASEAAKKWCLVSFILGLIGNGIYFATQMSQL